MSSLVCIVITLLLSPCTCYEYCAQNILVPVSHCQAILLEEAIIKHMLHNVEIIQITAQIYSVKHFMSQLCMISIKNLFVLRLNSLCFQTLCLKWSS